MSLFDQDELAAAYENIRCDTTDETWCAFTYEDKTLGPQQSGCDYSELFDLFADDQRVYAYVRFETGDEMSRRAKFAFITWIGPGVSPLKKAKVSTDKAFVKNAWPQFGKEFLADDRNEVKEKTIVDMLVKASGAAYGTGK